MTSVHVVGERSSDSFFLDSLAFPVGGRMVSVADHPRVGDYGACEFVYEFMTACGAEEFSSASRALGMEV